jgi:Mg2+-importing ATPase
MVAVAPSGGAKAHASDFEVQVDDQPFWHGPATALLEALDSNLHGLSQNQAIERLHSCGPNILQPHAKRVFLLQFLSHFRNPLILVLLGASGLSAFLGDVRSFAVITLIVLLSVLLDFVQEFRAGRAAERLRATVALRASVLRDNHIHDIPVAEIVPGDVVSLSAGDRVPADGRVREARDFFVNQALLTGEAYPVEKHALDSETADEIVNAANVVLMGTSVVSGSARVLVVRTGARTALAQIAHTLSLRPPATAFERGTHAFGMLILRLTMLLVLFVLLVNAVLHRPLLESFLFAVALAVGLTPELLPMVISVTLSRGAMRLTKHRVIVKRLSAVQDLGAIDVLCTDKTGTLTEGQIRLERHVDSFGQRSERVLELAFLNSYFETGIRSPLDEAILRHSPVDVSAWSKLDEVPFDFERRRVSVLVESAHRRKLVVKGSPEDVLSLCARYENGPGHNTSELDDEALTRIRHLYDDLSREGFRVLAVAWRDVPGDHQHAGLADESELVFVGFAAFLDPPKASAAHALAALKSSGIAVKVVTGDNELVARHVCAQLGLAVDQALSGKEIQHMDDQALRAKVELINLFCRVTPSQKTRILLALRARGRVIGFLGDGINDAPALHAADVGISVDSAVDVAKDAADLILLDKDLEILHEGVLEGRRTFSNVMKYIMMGTSSNFGNMFSMALGTLMLPFLPMLPLQIILNNFLYDLSEIAIPFDNVEERALARPHAWNMDFVRRFMISLGPVSSVFDLLTFFVLVHFFDASEAVFHTGWFVESIATQVLVIFIIRTRGSPFVNRPNVLLVVLSLSVLTAAALLPFTRFGQYLGFSPPAPALYLTISAIVLAYLTTVQIAKQLFYRHWESRVTQPTK